MKIRRAMPVIVSDDLTASEEFYVDFLGFEVGMREDGFLDVGSPDFPTTQMLVVSPEAPFDPEVTRVDISVEVGDVDARYADAQERGLEIVYPMTDEPWEIRRFFVRDPSGKVINVASHIADLPSH